MNNTIVKGSFIGTVILALGLLTFGCSDNTTTNPVGTQNDPPVLAFIGNKNIFENARLTIWLTATDPDGDLLSYSASGLPPGADLIGNIFSWKPTNAQTGSFSVTFFVSDGEDFDSKIVLITVMELSNQYHYKIAFTS